MSDVEQIRAKLAALTSLLDSGHFDGLRLVSANARSFAEASVLVFGDEQTGPRLAERLGLALKESYPAESTGKMHRRFLGEWAGVAVELTVAVESGEPA